jgi:ATP-binding protein involved in chromosome partitioning
MVIEADKKSELEKSKEPTEVKKNIDENEKLLRTRMSKVKHKIAIISGKGGVGKSVITANLAIAFSLHGHAKKVGILDADIHGPCIPKMLGIRGKHLQGGPMGAFPVSGPLGVEVVSMDFLLLEDETPVIWRGPLKMSAIRQFLSEIVWGNLDFLFIDLPPGTGDESLSVMQLLPEMDGVVIVTIPSEVSQVVVKKAVTFARQLNIPIIGIVENMSGFICPQCDAKYDIFKSGGGKKISDDLGVPFLGSIPIDPMICKDSDKGNPFVTEHPKSSAAEAFMNIVEKIETFLEEKKNKEETIAIKSSEKHHI